MKEVGVDLSDAKPRFLSDELAASETYEMAGLLRSVAVDAAGRDHSLTTRSRDRGVTA